MPNSPENPATAYSVIRYRVVPMQYVNREWLLDELEEIVYISDIQDYTLLYVNRVGREQIGMKLEDFEKKKCYQMLQEEIPRVHSAIMQSL